MILYITNSRSNGREYINSDFYETARNYEEIVFISKEEIYKYDLTKVSSIVRPTEYIGELAQATNSEVKLFNRKIPALVCDDKWLSFLECKKFNFPQPNTSLNYKDFEFPMIMKVRDSSFAKHVWLVNNEEEIKMIKITLDEARRNKIIYQEFVKGSWGESLRVLCIDKKVRFYYYRVNNDDFRANINRGAHVVCMNELDEKIKELCEDVCEKLDLNYVGIDILFDEEKNPVICELNSNALTHGYKDYTEVDIQEWYVKYLVELDREFMKGKL